MQDLPNLDFLRTVAVLSVVTEHTLLAYGVQQVGVFPVAWVGVVGVFLFFVHTATVLMWSLERRPHTLDFYTRRIFRLYPLALVAIAVTLIFHAPVDGTALHYFRFTPPHTPAEWVGGLLLVPNLLGSYLPMSVMWSLPFEVEMYLVLPLLFFLLARNLSLWLPLLLWGFTVALCRPLFQGVPYNFFLCIPYFLPGAMAYVGFSRYRARFGAWLFPLFLSLVWAAFLLWPSWRHADVLCLVVGLALPLFRQIRSPWLRLTSRHIARVSYSTYLLHPFAIVLGLYLLPHRSLPLQLTVIAGTTIVASLAGFHLVERPMIRLGSRLATRIERRFEQKSLSRLHIAEADIR